MINLCRGINSKIKREIITNILVETASLDIFGGNLCLARIIKECGGTAGMMWIIDL